MAENDLSEGTTPHMMMSESPRETGTTKPIKWLLPLFLVLLVIGLFVLAIVSSEQPEKPGPVAAEEKLAVVDDPGIEPWDDATKPPALKVLIVTPDVEKGYAAGIKQLLDKCGMRADVADPKKATAEFANAYDVLVVTGLGNYRSPGPIPADYTRPVVAYGVYGCDYLGSLRLKPGSPYT
jgi:hypothetical protein